MYLWHVVRAGDGRVELVDGWETLDALIAEMADSSWEEPDNRWVSYVTDDSTGEAVVRVRAGHGASGCRQRRQAAYVPGTACYRNMKLTTRGDATRASEAAIRLEVSPALVYSLVAAGLLFIRDRRRCAMTVKQAAERLEVSTSTIYGLVAMGKLKCCRVG